MGVREGGSEGGRERERRGEVERKGLNPLLNTRTMQGPFALSKKNYSVNLF